MSVNLRISCLLSITVGVLLSAVALPSQAATNCWVGPRNTSVAGKYQGKVIINGRCNKAFFYLVPGEGSRNVRSEPTTAGAIVGKLLEGETNNKFAAELIVSIDNGVTYWAYGTIVTADDSIYSRSIDAQTILPGLKGWIEVGNIDAIRQFDRPRTNDVWYRF